MIGINLLSAQQQGCLTSPRNGEHDMEQPAVTTSRPIVLVVDDTPDNLSLMNEVLRPNYRVKLANGGAKALQIARGETPPDLILLDIMMPQMDGYEVCRQLKENDRTRDIPIIFLTAKTGAIVKSGVWRRSGGTPI